MNQSVITKPPELIEVKISFGINVEKWKQYQDEGYPEQEIVKMFLADVEKTITFGHWRTTNRLLDDSSTDIQIVRGL